MATAMLPVTLAGMGTVEATVKVPSPLSTAPARALMEMGWAGVTLLPVFVYSAVDHPISTARRRVPPAGKNSGEYRKCLQNGQPND